jgi:N-acetylglucosamine malate deacetylase 1
VWASLVLLAQLQAEQRTLLAIGAHAGDMELSAGALLAHQAKLGDRVVILHLTLGEGGNPKMSPRLYGDQKRSEAQAAAKALGAEVIFGPYPDGMLPDDESARKYVAGVIRELKPAYIITHWKSSIHKDHANTHAIVVDAVLLAELEAVETGHPPYRGVRGVYYAENWEDPEGFQPYLFVDTTGEFAQWEQAVRAYQFVRGGISTFPYFDYYSSLARVRGALAGRQYAVALDVDAPAKKVVVDSLR